MAKFLCIALAVCALGSAQGQFADLAGSLLRGGSSGGLGGSLASFGVDALTSRLTGGNSGSGSGIGGALAGLGVNALTNRLTGGSSGSGLSDIAGGLLRRGRSIPNVADLINTASQVTGPAASTAAGAVGAARNFLPIRVARGVPNFNGVFPFGIPKFDGLRNAFGGALDNVQGTAKAAFNNGGKAVKHVFDEIHELADDAQDFIGNAASRIFHHGANVADQATNAVNSVADVATNVADQATNAVNSVADVATPIVNDATNAATSVVADATNAATSVVADATNAATSVVNDATNAATSVADDVTNVAAQAANAVDSAADVAASVKVAL